MASEQAAPRRSPPFIDPPGYAQHRPEQTLLYRLVEQHYPAFLALRGAAGRPLPGYVQQEFEKYLKCGLLEHGFLRVRCESCHAEKLVAFSCKGRGFCPSCGARRMAESAGIRRASLCSGRPCRSESKETIPAIHDRWDAARVDQFHFLKRPLTATELAAVAGGDQV